jgi:hypothetical protein
VKAFLVLVLVTASVAVLADGKIQGNVPEIVSIYSVFGFDGPACK